MQGDTNAGGENDAIETRRRRAIFRAGHRGTREMDWLLGRYAAARVAGMSADELTRFEQLIQLPDPDLNAWILDPSLIAGQEYAAEIRALRQFHDLEATSTPSEAVSDR